MVKYTHEEEIVDEQLDKMIAALEKYNKKLEITLKMLEEGKTQEEIINELKKLK